MLIAKIKLSLKIKTPQSLSFFILLCLIRNKKTSLSIPADKRVLVGARIIVTVLTMLIMNFSIVMIPMTLRSTVGSLQPTVTALCAYLMFAEKTSKTEMIMSVVCLACVIYLIQNPTEEHE